MYSSNVPDYNKFRLIPLETKNPDNVGIFCIVAARDTMPQLIGMATLTLEPNMWLGDEEVRHAMVDYFGNNALLTELCAAIANCIRDSEAVQNELRDVILGDGIGGGTGGNPGSYDPVPQLGDIDILEDVTCDTDDVYGTIVGVLTSMANAVLDVLERVHAIADKAAKASELVRAIPGIRLNLVTESMFDVAEFAETLSDIVYTQYEAALSQGVVENLACAALCEVYNCELTVDTLYNVIVEQSSFTPSGGNLFDVFEAIGLLFLGSLTNEEKVASALLFMLEAQRRGGDFSYIGGGTRSIEQLLQLHADETNNNWSIICASCGTPKWSHEFDFTVSQSGFTAAVRNGTTRAQYINGEGFAQFQLSDYAQINSPIFASTDIHKIELYTNQQGNHQIYYPGAIGATLPPNMDTTLNTVIGAAEPNMTMTQFALSIYPTPTGRRITKCKVYGTGNNPFI